ncbi:MAG: hypothetical protein H0V30_04940 [Chitinophagaceae bacterium]|jgi:hypothetical protein|nr:hypothetical protein [Chitinophagaceae bacterium]
MENELTASSSLFGLSINETNRVDLADAARWARFLAIIGFIMCGLIVLVGIFAGSLFSMFMNTNEIEGMEGFGGGMPPGFGGAMAVVYIILALIYFFPCLFLFRFANQMKTALASNEQSALNSSFQNLKSMFRFFGIVTIIMLALYAIILLIAVVGAAAMS